MSTYRSKMRSPHSIGADCLRTLRKGCAQSETLYTDCGTAQHTGGHPSSAVCRPPRPGLQTDAARGVPTVCGGGTGTLQPDMAARPAPASQYRNAQAAAARLGRFAHALRGPQCGFGTSVHQQRPQPGLRPPSHTRAERRLGPRRCHVSASNKQRGFRRMPTSTPSPVAPTGAHGRVSHGLWGPKGNHWASARQRGPQPGCRPRQWASGQGATHGTLPQRARALGRALRRLSLAACSQADSQLGPQCSRVLIARCGSYYLPHFLSRTVDTHHA